jgi:acetylornithine deacetylase/succinyl-diaminopimelate desuccinylase-like protein
VRVLEPGGEADLALEPLEAERGGEAGVEHLEGHRAVVLEVAGEVDGGHAAPADLAPNLVPAGQRLAQAFRLAHASLPRPRCGNRHLGPK